MKTIVLAVTNDLVNDQRVIKVISTLKKSGCDIVFVGRRMKSSQSVNSDDYKAVRFNLLFNRNFLFYAEFNFRLFFYLLFKKVHLLVANDLDTLPAMYLASRLKAVSLVYDSHEFFTGSGEIQNRKFVQNIWKGIEGFIFPRLKFTMTVNESIAGLYEEKYRIRPVVVRNFARYKMPLASSFDLPFDSDGRQFFIIQGTGLNVDRGIEEAVLAVKLIPDVLLVILGKGLAMPSVKELIHRERLEDKVILLDTLPYEKMMQITSRAKAGLSLDKPVSLNYLYSLPNKISDYVQARVPVIASEIPEVSALVREHDIGLICNEVEPAEIAGCIKLLLENENLYRQFKSNIEKTAGVICWENEEFKLIDLYTKAGISFEDS